jgi:hypothetical protein
MTGQDLRLIPSSRCAVRSPKAKEPASGRPPVSITIARRRWLLPKEQGAYAEIGFPLLTVLLLGMPGSGALMLVLAVVCVFLLHEPVLVLLGHRGTRLRREAGRAAARLASVFAAGSFGFGIAGLWMSPPTARWGALVPFILGVAHLPLMATRREKSLSGELLAATTLVTACVPVALAASLPIAATLTVSIVWGVTFGLGTLAVRSTVTDAKGGAGRLKVAALLLALGAMLVAVWIVAVPGLPTGRAALAALPGSVVTIGLIALQIPPRRVRGIGWTIAASNLITLSLLLVLL